MNRILKRQGGFSLISTMTGLIVGMMVAASALGTVAFMEAQKRTAMGSNSALANGALPALASRPVILVTAKGAVRVVTHLANNGVVSTELPVNIAPPPRTMAWKPVTR